MRYDIACPIAVFFLLILSALPTNAQFSDDSKQIKPPEEVSGAGPGEVIAKSSTGIIYKATPFCVHLKYHTNFYFYYSESYIEAWAESGDCKRPGNRFNLREITIAWRNADVSIGHKTCTNRFNCDETVKMYGQGVTTVVCARVHAEFDDVQKSDFYVPKDCKYVPF